jgi:hypothetical protein
MRIVKIVGLRGRGRCKVCDQTQLLRQDRQILANASDCSGDRGISTRAKDARSPGRLYRQERGEKSKMLTKYQELHSAIVGPGTHRQPATRSFA